MADFHDALGRTVNDIAVVDVVLTVAGGFAIAKALDVSSVMTIPALFLVGIITHKALGIETKIKI
jgi:hypothetical protein